MQQHLYVMVAYAMLGLALGLWPHLAMPGAAGSEPRFRISPDLTSHATTVALSVAALLAMLALGSPIASLLMASFVSLSLGWAMARGGFDFRALAAGFLALAVSTTLPWWLRPPTGTFALSVANVAAFTLLTGAALWALSRKAQDTARYPFVSLFFYALAAGVCSFSSSPFTDDIVYRMAWHHWGAYIGPAELMLSGGEIFYDFPAQYGLGPTSLIAAACGKDCWTGMVFIAGGATLAFSVLIAAMALAFVRAPWPKRLTVLALCLAVCFFWTAYPPHVGSTTATPSVSGLRFLPVTSLVAFLFFAAPSAGSKLLLAGHGLWAIGAAWAPESAFYCTFVWWPYYLFIHRGAGSFRTRAAGFAFAMLRLAAVAIGLIATAALTLRSIYPHAPTLYGYLAYVLNPPGPLQITPDGAICFIVTVAGAGLLTLVSLWRGSGDTPLFRQGFVLLLVSYAAFSYFLGRSHDNNILNILPFFLLVLLHATVAGKAEGAAKIAPVLIATVLGWLAVFGWHDWNRNLAKGALLEFKPQSVANNFVSANRQADAGRAVETLQRETGEPVTVLDDAHLLIRDRPESIWSVMTPTANFAYVPSEFRREFLQRTARFLKRPGWLVVDRNMREGDWWLADFDTAYDRTARREFGSYYAIRFSPKGL